VILNSAELSISVNGRATWYFSWRKCVRDRLYFSLIQFKIVLVWLTALGLFGPFSCSICL